MPDRAEAYRILDTERNHQDAKYPETAPIAQYIDIISKYADRAKAALREGDVAEYDVVMSSLRKIGAVSVRAIEHWGAPMREITASMGARYDNPQ